VLSDKLRRNSLKGRDLHDVNPIMNMGLTVTITAERCLPVKSLPERYCSSVPGGRDRRRMKGEGFIRAMDGSGDSRWGARGRR
jgi:hypothetical protein